MTAVADSPSSASGGGTDAPVRVLVVDDHRAFAELLAFALGAEGDIACVGTADNADEALAKVNDLQPDVVVVDIEMPRQNGLAITRRVRQLRENTVVIVVTAHQDPAWMVRATQAGASGFVPKNGSLHEILDAVRRARHGGMHVAPSAFATPTAVPSSQSEGTPQVVLTTREQDVLAYLGKGMAPKAIARVLGISVHTCRGYVKALLAKLEVSSQLEAVVKAQRLGLVPA